VMAKDIAEHAGLALDALEEQAILFNGFGA
jgi:hypothetical protein